MFVHVEMLGLLRKRLWYRFLVVFGYRFMVVFGYRFWKIIFFFEKTVFRCGLLRNRTRKEIFGKTFGTVIKKTAPEKKYLGRFYWRHLVRLLRKPHQILIFCYGFKTVPKPILFFGTLVFGTVLKPHQKAFKTVPNEIFV